MRVAGWGLGGSVKRTRSLPDSIYGANHQKHIFKVVSVRVIRNSRMLVLNVFLCISVPVIFSQGLWTAQVIRKRQGGWTTFSGPLYNAF